MAERDSIDDLAAVSWLHAALACRCPRCGDGRCSTGLLRVRRGCAACGLDLSAQDAGDGPAVFVILFLGADRRRPRGDRRDRILAADLGASGAVDAADPRRGDRDAAAV